MLIIVVLWGRLWQHIYYKLHLQTVLLSFPYSMQNISLKRFYNHGLWQIVWKVLQKRGGGLFLLERRKQKKSGKILRKSLQRDGVNTSLPDIIEQRSSWWISDLWFLTNSHLLQCLIGTDGWLEGKKTRMIEKKPLKFAICGTAVM